MKKLTGDALAKRLAATDLTDEELRVVEALGFRAMQSCADEVVQAVGIVISALQGNYNVK